MTKLQTMSPHWVMTTFPTYGKVRVFFDGAGDGGSGGDGDGGAPGGDGGGAPPAFDGATYRDHLPDDLKGSDVLAKYANLEELARGAIHSQQLVGRDASTLITKPDVTDANAVRGVLQQIGLPAELTDDMYQAQGLDDLPDELKGDGKMLSDFRTEAHKLGIMPAQFQGVVDWFMGQGKETMQSEATNIAAAEQEDLRALEAQWGGQDTPSFKERVACANFAVDKLGGAALQDTLNDAGLGRNPTVLFALDQIGKLLSEDGVDLPELSTPGTTSTGGNFNQTITPDAARSQARELQREAMQHQFKNPGEARRLNNEAQKLYQLANGGR